MAERNLDIILGGLAGALRDRDPDAISALLAPDVVWEGVRPGSRCQGREEAMGLLGRRLAAAPLAVEAVEAIDCGAQVVLGLRGPGFNGVPGDRDTVGQTYHVFRLSEGKVVRWRSFLSRPEAMAAAAASDWDRP